MAAFDQERFGEIWPGWHIGEQIGKGSFGFVYEARKTGPDGIVQTAAVKHLWIPQSGDKDPYRMFPDEVRKEEYAAQWETLVAELDAMQASCTCEYMVQYQDSRMYERPDGLRYDMFIRMEKLIPLKSWIEGMGNSITTRTLLNIGHDVCRALITMQAENKIHRDIKPGNLFYDPVNEMIKVGDFGTARELRSNGEVTSDTGTREYMAPEMATNHYGKTVDMYALGIVLYRYMNMNKLPLARSYSGEEQRAATDRRFAGESFPPPEYGDERLKRIVMRTL